MYLLNNIISNLHFIPGGRLSKNVDIIESKFTSKEYTMLNNFSADSGNFLQYKSYVSLLRTYFYLITNEYTLQIYSIFIRNF